MNRSTIILRKTVFFICCIAGVAAIIGIVSAQAVQDKQSEPFVKSSLSIGEMVSPHPYHSDDLELECEICHHEANAGSLPIMHNEYFDDFWNNCRICHKSNRSEVSQPQSCSNCHHDSPASISDETLSAKAVIHMKCWECHESEKGEKASKSCSDCHQGANPDNTDNLGFLAMFLKKGRCP